LVGAPDADILTAAIEILRNRIAAGTATFLVKVKAHRGGPANERADILADKAISYPKVGKEWCQRANRAVFTWKKPCREAGKETYQDCHSTFNNSVGGAIRRGAAENEVQKHEEKLTGAWRQMSKLRRRYEIWVKVMTQRTAPEHVVFRLANVGNCRHYSGSQMARKNRTAIRCKL